MIYITNIIWREIMATTILSTTVDKKIANQLEKLAKETHRKKSYYVNQALKEYLEEIHDYDLALSRKGGKSIPLKKAKKELGI